MIESSFLIEKKESFAGHSPIGNTKKKIKNGQTNELVEKNREIGCVETTHSMCFIKQGAKFFCPLMSRTRAQNELWIMRSINDLRKGERVVLADLSLMNLRDRSHFLN